MAFAKIHIIGNVGKDPEMRYTPQGRPVTSFSVAVGHSKPDGSGGWIDEGTDWFRVTVWGDRAERVAEQVSKGDKVFVTGRFRNREYETKDGRKGTSLDVSADDVIDLSGKKAESGESRQPRPSSNTETGADSDFDPDELPF